MGNLVLARKLDQRILIGEDIVVTVVEIRRDAVRLMVTAPNEIEIDRPEVRASKRGMRRNNDGRAV